MEVYAAAAAAFTPGLVLFLQALRQSPFMHRCNHKGAKCGRQGVTKPKNERHECIIHAESLQCFLQSRSLCYQHQLDDSLFLTPAFVSFLPRK